MKAGRLWLLPESGAVNSALVSAKTKKEKKKKGDLSKLA